MSQQDALTTEHQKLNDLWEAPLRAGFEAHSADVVLGGFDADNLTTHEHLDRAVLPVVGAQDARSILDRNILLNRMICRQDQHARLSALPRVQRATGWQKRLITEHAQMKITTLKAIFASMNPSPVFEVISEFAEHGAGSRACIGLSVELGPRVDSSANNLRR